MRCNFVRFVAVAVVLSITAGTAWAFPPANPYVVPPSVLQKVADGGLTVDRTLDFSGNSQASTAVTSQIPGGIQVNAHWTTGNSFPDGNETFTRIVLTQQYGGDFGGDGDRGDLNAYDGASWIVTSDIAFAVKPYTQVGGTFAFYEGNQADTGCGVGTICVPGGNVPTLVQIDWNSVGGGPIPAGSPGGRDDIFEHGFQIFGPPVPQDTGQFIDSVFTITNVPEPASLALLGLGSLVVAGMVRRGRRG